MTAETGLRERKKTATRQALYEAALRLATEHGAERLTVEAIADEAGVSRRTFSNYFANKEEALLYGDEQRMRVLLGEVRARPAGEPVWAALTAAAAGFYRGRDEAVRGRLVRTHPPLVARHASMFAALERELAEEVGARTGNGVDLRARLIAATFLTTLRVALTVWQDGPAGVPLADLIERTLDEAGRGYRAATPDNTRSS